MGEGMHGLDVDSADVGDKLAKTVLHLVGSLDGIGDGKHSEGLIRAVSQDPLDPSGKDLGLARPGAGRDHDRGCVGGDNGGLLGTWLLVGDHACFPRTVSDGESAARISPVRRSTGSGQLSLSGYRLIGSSAR